MDSNGKKAKVRGSNWLVRSQTTKERVCFVGWPVVVVIVVYSMNSENFCLTSNKTLDVGGTQYRRHQKLQQQRRRRSITCSNHSSSSSILWNWYSNGCFNSKSKKIRHNTTVVVKFFLSYLSFLLMSSLWADLIVGKYVTGRIQVTVFFDLDTTKKTNPLWFSKPSLLLRQQQQ